MLRTMKPVSHAVSHRDLANVNSLPSLGNDGASTQTFEQQMMKTSKWAKRFFDDHLNKQLSKNGHLSVNQNLNRNKFNYLK